MSLFLELTGRMRKALEIPDLFIPTAGVTFVKKGDRVPEAVLDCRPGDMTVTSCHAIRSAMLGDAVYLTEKNIGCVAAAISLGLVEKNHDRPLEGPRVYTEIMRQSSGKGSDFMPPSPAEFSNGTVYASKATGKEEYNLFGREDSGRYQNRSLAEKAASEMMAVQPPTTLGIFYFSPDFTDADVKPDVVVLSLRPVELCRVVQGIQYRTGERIHADMGGLRAGCSDLLVRPFVTGKINVSPYCLGARLIARFEGDRMGMGMPFSLFKTLIHGLEESRTGYPFPKYPGAGDH
jgi:uncharacterized protein (DUF169 family)